jgi:hypothetical protein
MRTPPPICEAEEVGIFKRPQFGNFLKNLFSKVFCNLHGGLSEESRARQISCVL